MIRDRLPTLRGAADVTRAQWPCKRRIGSSMTHGDANENGDVLARASTAAFAEHGQASHAVWILGAWAEQVA
jgi:hypothetical protein